MPDTNICYKTEPFDALLANYLYLCHTIDIIFKQ